MCGSRFRYPRVDSLSKAAILLGLDADQEEGRLDILVVQLIEDQRSPRRVGTVVESYGDLVGQAPY